MAVDDDKRERGPYASGLARREAILDAAVDLLAEVGYHGMSLRDVARRVDISHPGVIYHFPNKEALLMAVVERYEMAAGFELDSLAKMDPMAIIDTLMTLSQRLLESPMIIEMECMLVVEASSALHPAHEHFADRNAKLLQVVSKGWSRLQMEGKARPNQDPAQVASTFLSLWYGLFTLWLYNREIDVIGILAGASLSRFSPEFYEEAVAHYKECGWIS